MARPVGKQEIAKTPAAQRALDIEWDKLVKAGVWSVEAREWGEVVKDAQKRGVKAHVGGVFEVCVERK